MKFSNNHNLQVKYKKHKKKSDKRKGAGGNLSERPNKELLLQHLAMCHYPSGRSTASVRSAPAAVYPNRSPENQSEGYSTDDAGGPSSSWGFRFHHKTENNHLISELLECEKYLNIVNYSLPLNQVVDEESQNNTNRILCDLGDNIVRQLVQWMRHLPFYAELPLSLHTKILTGRWHEILLLTMAAHQPAQKDEVQRHSDSFVSLRRKPSFLSPPKELNSAGDSGNSDGGRTSSSPNMTSSGENSNEAMWTDDAPENELVLKKSLFPTSQSKEPYPIDFPAEVQRNLKKLHWYLTRDMGKQTTLEQVEKESGVMMEKITYLIKRFRELKLSKEEYVCLKVILLLNHGKLGCLHFSHQRRKLF